MSDGPRIRQSYSEALTNAESHFRQLLLSHSSPEWKRIATTYSQSTSIKKGKGRALHPPEVSDVIAHRNSSKPGENVYRLILDVPTGEDPITLEPWKLILSTPEIRQEWDPAVEDAHLVELLDPATRICKTNFMLGWPANPRDAVTISRSFHDSSTVIDISTSLPRSPDEPAYLRPSPPFVRSNVALFGWLVQYIPPASHATNPEEKPKRRNSATGKIRVTCLWQHDLRAVWNFGTSSFVQQLSTMMVGLYKSVMKRGSRVPKLTGFGNGVVIERMRFQIDREALSINYAILADEEDHHEQLHGIDDLNALKEQRRLTRSVECILPIAEGWDVQVSTKASSEEVERLPWTTQAIRSNIVSSSTAETSSQDQIVFKVSHSEVPDKNAVLKVFVVIEISGPSSGLRLNGIPQTIQEIVERDPFSFSKSTQMLQDISSTADQSFNTASSINTSASATSSTSALSPTTTRIAAERTAAVDKSILSRVRRNYIYFSSLLQEPEAKWRRTAEARGVSVTQLDSIDPTLVVYKAEATFVGVGLLDLFGAVASPGSRAYWDKQHEEASLLEDVNDLTELWHFKTKPAWPAVGRDSVVLKTVYKSPTSIHVFLFSVDDPHVFPGIPPIDPNIIRTQVDLQGWVIESLSPNTTLLTLLEQSDPKGWANKTSIPAQMISALAGIGNFAIKFGGPPVVTRLLGAKANDLRYDHERLSFKIEYEPAVSRRPVPSNEEDPSSYNHAPAIECEIRCDIDTWAHSLDIVVDPPPQSTSCLRRHKLSADGGGLWLTFTHDSIFVDDERVLTIIRKSPGRERGIVMVNGSKIQIDVEELPEAEIKSLSKQKRVKPARIPLDQPPVAGVIRRRRAEWGNDTDGEVPTERSSPVSDSFAPKIGSPLSRFWTYTVDQTVTATKQAVSAVSPTSLSGDDGVPPSTKLPMQYALDALAWTQQVHDQSSSADWSTVSDKGLAIHRKLSPEISPTIPVHKGEKVIEGFSAEELAAVIISSTCRKKWDERFENRRVLQTFGADCRTAFMSSKANFPFRDRGFYVASVTARAHLHPSLARRISGSSDVGSRSPRNALFWVSASFSPDSIPEFSAGKVNPSNLPVGRLFVDAWILETLDPYTKENYAVPSTRCTRMVAVDYGGSIPAAVNGIINSSLPRSILSLENFVKNSLPAPLPTIRTPATGLLISSTQSNSDDEAVTVWKLRKRDDHRSLVSSHFVFEERIYKSILLLSFPVVNHHSRMSTKLSDTTPRPSRLLLDSPLIRSASQDRDSDPSVSDADLANMSNSASSLASDATLTPVSGLPGSARASSPVTSGLPASITSPATLSPSQSSGHQRTMSATSRSESTSPGASPLRGRSPTSAFSLKAKGPPKDMIIAEVVVDSQMYLGGYEVNLRSWIIKDDSKDRHPPVSLLRPSSISTQASAETTQENSDDIPSMQYTVYTLPSSALRSSNADPDSMTRHMIRATIPTAKYDIQTLLDPLTGETQSPPDKPEWLLHLEDGGRIGIEVDVRPSTTSHSRSRERKEKEDKVATGRKSRRKGKVRVNGVEVKVLSEKDSLSSLGREELIPSDEGVGKWAVVSRVAATSDSAFPFELTDPIGVAEDLLNDPSPLIEDTTPLLSDAGPPTPALENVSESDQSSVANDTAQGISLADTSLSAADRNGWMGYLYPRSLLTRLGNSDKGTPFAAASTGSLSRHSTPGSSVLDGNSSEKDAPDESPSSRLLEVPADERLQPSRRRRRPKSQQSGQGLHSTQTLLAVALIAFLFGSLIRSMLSPADFLYIPPTEPVSDAEHGETSAHLNTDGHQHPTGGEWREVRRLFQIKLARTGWDLVFGTVKRQ